MIEIAPSQHFKKNISQMSFKHTIEITLYSLKHTEKGQNCGAENCSTKQYSHYKTITDIEKMTTPMYKIGKMIFIIKTLQHSDMLQTS